MIYSYLAPQTVSSQPPHQHECVWLSRTHHRVTDTAGPSFCFQAVQTNQGTTDKKSRYRLSSGIGSTIPSTLQNNKLSETPKQPRSYTPPPSINSMQVKWRARYLKSHVNNSRHYVWVGTDSAESLQHKRATRSADFLSLHCCLGMMSASNQNNHHSLCIASDHVFIK